MKRISKIPVTIITGFLGAGKTTFINNLLQKYSNTQFALVENEFGDVSIDTKLIKGLNTSQMFELKQGCICCTISDEFELVLQELAERFPNIEHLLIETTGIADPTSVIRPFFYDEYLKEIYKYNGTICLVDALNFKSYPEKEILIKQLVTADLVLVNKTEQFSFKQKENFQKTIKSIAPFSNILLTEFSSTEQIDINNIVKRKHREFEFVSYHSTRTSIQTKTLSFSQLLQKNEFERWLSYTLDIHKNKIYRTKGILYFENELYEYILQGVGGSYEVLEGDLVSGEAKSELVFIGKLEGLELEFNNH